MVAVLGGHAVPQVFKSQRFFRVFLVCSFGVLSRVAGLAQASPSPGFCAAGMRRGPGRAPVTSQILSMLWVLLPASWACAWTKVLAPFLTHGIGHSRGSSGFPWLSSQGQVGQTTAVKPFH